MQRYSIWQALPRAFYSRSLYQDVDKHWRGKGLGYLFVVCFVCSIPLLNVAHNLATRLANDLRITAAQIPEITIKDGVASIEKTMPYEIKEPETNKTVVIIDTNKQASSIHTAPFLILLSKNRLIINTDKNTTKTYELANIKNAVIDQTLINTWVKILISILFAIFYTLAILLYFLPSLLATFFYAGIAKLFVRSHHTYSELCRLTAVALTPTLVLLTVLANLNIALPYRNIVYLILSLGYLTFAIEANRPHENP